VGDVFRAESSDAAAQIDRALHRIDEEGGVLLYMHLYGGRSAESLINTLRSHLLPAIETGDNPPPRRRAPSTTLREFGTGAQILLHLGLRRLRLLTNNPRKIAGLEGYGLEVVERVPIEIEATDANRDLLAAKIEEQGHLLELPRK
jgi:3,4-dihydroxy 2-butanone 4-phosphate synthase/GTP cyclohydrolase II